MGTYAGEPSPPSPPPELDPLSGSFGDLALVGIGWSVVVAVIAPVLVFGKSEGQSDKCRKGTNLQTEVFLPVVCGIVNRTVRGPH